MSRASAMASTPSASSRASASGRPASQRYTDHGNGYPSPGTPAATGCGMGNGSREASRGSHSCSFATWPV